MQTFKEWMTKKESFEPEHIFTGLGVDRKPAIYSHPSRGGLLNKGVRVEDDKLIISKPKIGGKVGDIARTVASYFGGESMSLEDAVKAFYKDLKDRGYWVEKPVEEDFGFVLNFRNNLDAQKAFHRTKDLQS